MIDLDLPWRTQRLVVEPMERCTPLAQRTFAGNDEVWGKWSLREASSDDLVGTVRVALPAGGPGSDVARVALEIGQSFQRRGYASEAAVTLVDLLLADNWCVVAEIHPQDAVSQRVAQRAGLVPTERIVEGNVQWWVDPWAGREITNSVWAPWDPNQVAGRLIGVDVPWCVAAGWALDLFRGGQSREHEDVEIAVPIGGFEQIRTALGEYEFEVVGAGHRWPIDSPVFDVMTQTWMSDRATGVFHLDIFREPHDGETWVCRRDPSIQRPYADIIETTEDGIPYLAPEVALLFKAKHSREKDESDFYRVLPLLDQQRRVWLADALARVHPGHRWLQALRQL